MTTTPNLGLTLPTVGADSNTWGGELNTDLTAIDAIFSASGTHVSLNTPTIAGAAVFTTSLGVGIVPTNYIDVLTNENAFSRIHIKNQYTGSTAAAAFSAENDAGSFVNLYMLSSGYSTSGTRRADGMLLQNTGGGGITIENNNTTPIYFSINSTEVSRFATDGSFLVGATTAGGWNSVSKGEFRQTGNAREALSVYNASTNGSALDLRVDFTNSNLAVMFFGGTSVGSITTNGTSTSYNMSSDARLKNNISDAADPGTIIDGLRVRQWDWKSNQTHEAYGFVAQELVEAYAPAVTVGDDDKEITKQWSRDDSKLVPVLVKELQLLRARVAALESAR